MKLRGDGTSAEPAAAVAASDVDDERLAGELLVAAGLVQPYQLDAATAAQTHRNPGRAADRRRRGPGRGDWRASSPSTTDVRWSTSGTSTPDPDALALLTPEQARTLRALPHRSSTATR